MKRDNKIWTIVVALVALCSCSQEAIIGDEEIPVPVAPEGYIFFDAAMKTNSRGTIMRDNLHADFRVLGYRYPATWSSAATLAQQSSTISFTDNSGTLTSEYMGVFHPMVIVDDKETPSQLPTHQQVTWNGTTHSYTNPQEWENNLKYAFFAWYPATLVANGGNSDLIGKPYITYTLPEGEDRVARQNMHDVLTAERIDYQKRIYGASVVLNMKHRLAGLDIKAGSLINAKGLKETYGTKDADNYVEAWDKETLEDSEAVTLTISDFTLTLENIKTSVKIELNPDYTANGISLTPSGSATKIYTGFEGTTGIGYYNSNADLKTLVGNDEKLILIPQNDAIKVSMSMNYTITCKGASKTLPASVSGITIDKLEENNYYYLLLNFTKSGLFVKTQVTNLWEEKTIDHTFN